MPFGGLRHRSSPGLADRLVDRVGCDPALQVGILRAFIARRDAADELRTAIFLHEARVFGLISKEGDGHNGFAGRQSLLGITGAYEEQPTAESLGCRPSHSA